MDTALPFAVLRVHVVWIVPAESTIAVHGHVPYRCRPVCVCGSRARLARSERSRRRCSGAS